MDETQQWTIWSKNLLAEFEGWRGQTGYAHENEIKAITIVDWSLVLFRELARTSSHQRAQKNLQRWLEDPRMQAAFQLDLGKVFIDWKQLHYQGAQAITRDMVAEWSYAFIQEIGELSRKEIGDELGSMLGEKLKRQPMPPFIRRRAQRAARQLARKFAGGPPG